MAGTLKVMHQRSFGTLRTGVCGNERVSPHEEHCSCSGSRTRAAGGPATAQDKTIKIGFISTFSGPAGAIGTDMKNAFELGLDHLGRKLGGLPVEVIYEDDQQKPEIGVQKTQKLLESDHVDFVAGYIWSNVMLGSLKPLVETKTITVITNAGASQLAGEMCSPYVFSTSFNNDQAPQSLGLYLNQKGIKKVFMMGPNYAAGRDMLQGLRRSPIRANSSARR